MAEGAFRAGGALTVDVAGVLNSSSCGMKQLAVPLMVVSPARQVFAVITHNKMKISIKVVFFAFI